MDTPSAPKSGASSTRPPESRGRIYDSVLETVGATPLVRLSRLMEARNCRADLLGKCEFFNPLSSVKDRIGVAMIEALEVSGKIGPETTIIEPTSGNTGIALAFACAAKGYRLILTMPETSSTERRKMLKLLGAELELTDGTLGMRGALDRADALREEIGDAVIPQQFDNPANPEIHMRTTAEEIWADTDGKVDILVSSVGTGGTLTGVGRVLRQHNPDLHIVAVEPEDSAVLSGGMPGPHRIEGIGAGFVPGNLDTSLIDEVLKIGNDTAFRTARLTASIEGLPVGISSGAALAAALEVGERHESAGKAMVAILPSMAERYLSTQLFEGL
ncbi:cysteine synthase A [Fodinicurvata fenggangensis]|uniref:cysteine synthase A n=1 Tax=Fodinicurvata fenggangensis TaxID=1121830 RepID=UPI00068C6B6C|nr:cysteine synthase A [Fodinicurvata fenggangensis]